ncbi:hypothetical protein [Marilutibacter spongiae]|uniref:Uncharacterized protein n=1 Tax=Marilutibacter spongiae TaxID=2025720 RepID=A0A7W3TP51_9GAMM|nr:hypothetical protein [Lysobacter spongiae]MBB1061902.1 hypothetical protein [Lysobacter spongiae]
MKLAPHFLPPRQSVVYGYTRRMLDETATNANSFAMAVAEHYLATVAPDVRHVPFKLGEGDALLAAMKANGQTLRRYMDGTVKVLPADLEDAWVMALPEAYRSACERDLAKRRGRLSIAAIEDAPHAPAVGMAALATEFAQLVEALAPALADGKLNADDLPHAKRILNESDDLMAALLGMRRQVTALLPEGDAAHA